MSRSCSTESEDEVRRTMKQALGFTGVLGFLLAVALCVAVATVPGVRQELRRSMGPGMKQEFRGVWRKFHGSVAAVAVQAASESQAIVPRAQDFLLPQRLDDWQIIGPGGGGTFYNASISPHDPNLVFATTDMSECYVSENGGRTWRTFNLRSSCRFVFDPKLPNRVYAMSTGLWRSDDRGHTWSMIYPEPSKVGYTDDEAEPYLQSPKGYPLSVPSMDVDPDDSNTLYISV